MFWASRIRIQIRHYLDGSGSFHHQAKKSKKTLIYTVFCLILWLFIFESFYLTKRAGSDPDLNPDPNLHISLWGIKSPSFQEAATRRLEIVDFAPEIVEAMLFYVYTGEVANLDEVLPAYSAQNRRSRSEHYGGFLILLDLVQICPSSSW